MHVGQNDTCVPFKVGLLDLVQQSSNSSVYAATFDVYNNGALTNSSQLYPGQTAYYTVNGNVLRVTLNQTVPGLAVYNRLAKFILNVT